MVALLQRCKSQTDPVIITYYNILNLLVSYLKLEYRILYYNIIQ